MALSVHALTRYSTVRDEVGLTSAADSVWQTKIERYIEAASAEIEGIACRHFHRYTSVVERYMGPGMFRLILRQVPIVSISAIAILNQDGTVAETVDSTTYEIEDADAGFVYRTGGWPWTARNGVGVSIEATPLAGTERKSIRVTYTGGYVTPEQAATVGTRDLPYDIEEACIMGAVYAYTWSGRNREVASESSAGGSSVSYVNPNMIIGEGSSILPQAAQRIAKRYRREWSS